MSSTINAGTSGLVLTGSTTTTLSLATNGTTRATIDASGNVGIGTATPIQTLEVKSNNAYGQFTIDSAGGQYSQMFFKNNGTAVGSLFTDNSNNFLEVYGYSNVGIKFTTNNSERMRLDTSGNLGIGTSSPGSLDPDADNLVVGGGSGNTGISIYSGNASGGRLMFADGTSGDGPYVGQIHYDHSSNYMRFITNGGERMRIDSSGNVGIGTASPTNKFQVSGDGARSVSQAATNTGYAEVEAQVYNYWGGTGGPTYTGTAIAQWGAGATGTSAGIARANLGELRFQNGSGGLIYTNGATPLVFATTSTERMRINSSGNVGIGTASPDANHRLHVVNTGAKHGIFAQIDDTAYYCQQNWNSAGSGDNKFASFLTDVGATLRGSIDYNRAGGQVRYNTTSDYRAKDVYGAWNDSGATIDALKVYRGKMHGATQERPMMIAHEAQAVVPYAVGGEKDAVDKDGKPVYQTMDHQILVPLLIAELQAVRARLAALEAK